MSKYKFIKMPDPSNQFDISTVTVEIEVDSLNDLLEVFEDFLRASGFIINGSIEHVKEEDEN